jgi:hypothetical protein
MNALRFNANVSTDHTVTIQLPSEVPVGPAEVILLYKGDSIGSTSDENGPEILRALSSAGKSTVGFWNGAGEEVEKARDGWDRD